MALNGISTLSTKEQRRIAKLNLASLKRQSAGAGYRVLNYYIGTVSPFPGRPWSTFAPIAPDSLFIEEDLSGSDVEITAENGNIIVSE